MYFNRPITPFHINNYSIINRYLYRNFSEKSTDNEIPHIDVKASLYPTTISKIREARTIICRQVTVMRAGGKSRSFFAAVVAGNGEGGIGCGTSKDKRSRDAIIKATKDAEKNMEYFELYEERTLFHDVKSKFKATKLTVRPMPQGTIQ